MVVALNKRDYEFSPELLKPKNFELWAKVDSVGRKIIWRDSDYKISVDSYSSPSVLRIFTEATIGEKKVGELVCARKEYFGKQYICLTYVKINAPHKGAGFSFKMLNCLLAILDENIQGVITPYKKRNSPKLIYGLFEPLGGFVNDFGYLELTNPKRNKL